MNEAKGNKVKMRIKGKGQGRERQRDTHMESREINQKATSP